MGKKITIVLLSSVAFLLLVACVFAGLAIKKEQEIRYSREDLDLIQELKVFETVIDNGDYDDLVLTIYHTSPYGKRERLSVNELKELVNKQEDDGKSSIYKVFVTGEALLENKELLKNINTSTIKIKDNKYWSIDTRIYYEFEYKDEVILRVALWGYPESSWPVYNGSNASALINGRFEVRGTEALCEIIIPFLHEDDAKNLNCFVKGTLPDFMLYQPESENPFLSTAIS